MDVSKKHKLECVDVNAHLHTPYSFSAFDKLTDALDRAVNENVKVVGINDFYSMDGYKEWNDGCIQRKLFPLFNIEFISLQEEDQAAGIRVNDPNNRAAPTSAAKASPTRSTCPNRTPRNWPTSAPNRTRR